MKRNYTLLSLSIIVSSVDLILPLPFNLILALGGLTLLFIAAWPLKYECDEPTKQKKGSQKPRKISEDLRREFDNLRKHKTLEVTRKIKLKPTNKIMTAKAGFCTISIGQSLLKTFNLDLQKATLAHELAHIKKNHYPISLVALILLPLVIAISMMAVLIFSFWWALGTVNIDLIFPNIFIIAFAFMVILFRPIGWPQEYEADLIAARIVGNDIMTTCLQNVAELRSQDMNRDFYRHPSFSKRINYIEQNNKTSG